ncbi:strigolactone esterase D14-like [Cucumis melo var. makuwa]|nr:strigolactone esterase D14-like [Cucumis melo var. makuwa]TYK25371.1 strigolactone esterase D14-like [Cucumis melo var. makuwa]
MNNGFNCRGGSAIAEALKVNVYGNGTETLVLAHGFGLDQNVWHYMIPYLACFFKVVVFDLVFSPNVKLELYDERKYSSFDGYAKDLLCVLDHLHVKRTIYVGHSMSAMVGCVAATYRPQLFHHLILLNASPRYLNGEGYIGGFEKPQVDEIFKEMDKNFTKWAKQFVPFAVIVNNSKAMAEIEHSLGRMNPKIALSVAKMVFLSDLTKLLPKVKTSTSIILTEKDNIVPKSVAFFIKSNIGGNSNVNILKSQGHFPQLTAYPQLLKVLTKVLQLKQYKIYQHLTN